jgi:hypothetical protein
MRNKIDWKDREFDGEVLKGLQKAIQRTKEAIKELESAWGEFVVDVAFKNTAPDGNYIDDVICALLDIQVLQNTLDGGQPGPLANFNEVLRRWDHNRIVVPLPRRLDSPASVPNTGNT